MKIMQWRLHANSDEYRKHIAHSRKIIHHAHEKGKCVLSWSAGKDSTAMTHLVKSIYPETPIIIQFDDCDWPEKREYVKRVSNRHGWKYYLVEPNFSVWENSLKYNIGFDYICATNHEFTKNTFLSLLNTKQKEIGCSVVFMGLRSQESHARSFNLKNRGELYQLKNKEWRCCPIGAWKVEDVFAYLIENDIEINPCYFHNRFKQPEDIRLCWALPMPAGITKGDLEHIRFYYPSQFQRLRSRGVIV
jgi:3'-phosphoadenosine 5'-phosphosulfate sulfotransferase (PAPS reductase)/FAD synthetase